MDCQPFHYGKRYEPHQNEVFRNLTCKRVQVDEIWSFCYPKQKNVAPNLQGVFGQADVYTWVALDADTNIAPLWMRAFDN